MTLQSSDFESSGDKVNTLDLHLHSANDHAYKLSNLAVR